MERLPSIDSIGVRKLLRAVRLDYSRGGCRVSLQRASALFLKPAAFFSFLTILTAAVFAQYPGHVSEKSKDNTPELRAVGVLEWTGEEGKPKTSRLVPATA